jgi:hypothetical protein
VGKEPAEQGVVGDDPGKQHGTVVAGVVGGPAVGGQELEEGQLLGRERGEDVVAGVGGDKERKPLTE